MNLFKSHTDKLSLTKLALTKISLTISCFCVINPILGKLESEIFTYPNPNVVKNIEITLKGKTKSGKKWIAFSINQLYKLGINPLSEMKKLPKKLIAGDKLDLSREENMEKYIKLWKKNCQEGYPYGGLFIYTDDNANDRKLISLITVNISENKTDEMEFSIAMRPEYQPKDNSEQFLYKIESDDNYRTSILEGIFEYGQEITKIGHDPNKFSTAKNNKENDEKVNSQIRSRFSLEYIKNKTIIQTPLLGFSSVCTLEDNWLQHHMAPYPYRSIPHIIADFKMDALAYFEEITKKEFLKIVFDILPQDGNTYSIFTPDSQLLTINNTLPYGVRAYYFKAFYTDAYMRPAPTIVRPLSVQFIK